MYTRHDGDEMMMTRATGSRRTEYNVQRAARGRPDAAIEHELTAASSSAALQVENAADCGRGDGPAAAVPGEWRRWSLLHNTCEPGVSIELAAAAGGTRRLHIGIFALLLF